MNDSGERTAANSEARRLGAGFGALALAAALLVFAFALGLQRTLNFDYGWHLRAGSWIAENWSVPRADAWTLSHEGERWIDIHWLFQLGAYGVWSLGGHAAVTAAKGLLVTAIAGLVAWTAGFRERPAIATLAAAAALVVAAPRFIVRPELVSLALLASQLALFDRFGRANEAALRQSRWRWVAAFVAIALIWANLQGLFAVGLAVIVVHIGAEVLRGLLGSGWRAEHARTLGIVLAGALLATLCNPNGLDGALFPLRQLGIIAATAEQGSNALLSEMLRTLDPRVGLADGARIAFLLLACATALAMLAALPRLRIVDPLLFGAFLYLALTANRNVALFAIVCGPILGRNLAIGVERLSLLGAQRAKRTSIAASAALIVALLWGTSMSASGALYPRIAYERDPGLGLQTAWYPEGAAAFVRVHDIPGPIANSMGDGGHLLFDLPADRKILTDGRFAGLGGERRFEFARLADLDRLHREHRFGAVVVPYAREPREAFLRELARTRHWRMVFVDDVSLVLVPSTQAATRHLPSIRLGSEATLEPIASDDPAAGRRYLARASWFAAANRFDAAVDAVSAAIALGASPEPSPVRAAWNLRAARTDDARDEALRAAEASKDAWELTGLANLLLRLGERDAAERALARAVEIDPGYEAARTRRELLASPDASTVRKVLALPRPERIVAGTSDERAAVEDGVAIGFGGLLALGTALRDRRRGSNRRRLGGQGQG